MTQVQGVRAGSRNELRGWFMAAAGVGLFFAGVAVTRAHKAHAAPPVEPVSTSAAAPSAPAEEGVTLSMIYSTEIAAWLRPAVEDFERSHAGVRVQLQGMGSLDAARAIATGRAHPTLWIPADASVLEQLDPEHGAQGAPAMVREDGRWPRPLALTPMVFVVWDSRAQVLAPHTTSLSWQRLATLARAPHGWADLGGDRAWGGLKFGHTDPSRSHSGLETLTLMAYGWRGRTGALSPADATSAGFVGFVRSLESADPAGDRGTASSGEFAQTIALQGPGRYDVAMVYESQAIASIDVARGRWGESLRVFYPPINVWSDHPLCLLDGERLTRGQRAAAEQLADHLRSATWQQAAVRYGLRPADPTVPLATDDAENPFVKYRDRGVTIALPQVADAPTMATLDALTATWRRATGR